MTTMSCNSCGTPAVNQCSRCHETAYCDRHCQRQDWPTDKNACKDSQLQQTLTQVADIAHKAYMKYRENTWNEAVDKVENGLQGLILYQGAKTPSTKSFTPFPHNLVKDEQSKMALLTAWKCEEPYVFLHTLITRLLLSASHHIHPIHILILKGLNIDTQQISVHLRAPPRRLSIVKNNGFQTLSNWPDHHHCLLRVTSRRTNKQWVFDLCGAQYGIYGAFHDWQQYRTRYVEGVVEANGSGFLRKKLTDLASSGEHPALKDALEVSVVLERAIESWEVHNGKLSQLRTLDPGDFEQRKSSLLGTLDDAVCTFSASKEFTEQVEREKGVESVDTGEACEVAQPSEESPRAG